MKEVYKDIVGFEGKYAVSNLGNVMSLNYLNTRKKKVLTPVKHHGGYLIVHLGANKIKMVHTLVAEAFIPKCEGKKYVNHIDGNKHNNIVSNLEWVTSKENMNHAIRTGLRNPHNTHAAFGADNINSVPVIQYSKDGKFIKKWDCISNAARYYNCNPCTLSNCISGKLKTAHGFVWRHEGKDLWDRGIYGVYSVKRKSPSKKND